MENGFIEEILHESDEKDTGGDNSAGAAEIIRSEWGFDNPFRPGGKLDREAETIVRLIKEGKPIYPLPSTPPAALIKQRPDDINEDDDADQRIESSSTSSLPSSPSQHSVANNHKNSDASNNTSQQQENNNLNAGNNNKNNKRNKKKKNGNNNDQMDQQQSTSPIHVQMVKSNGSVNGYNQQQQQQQQLSPTHVPSSSSLSKNHHHYDHHSSSNETTGVTEGKIKKVVLFSSPDGMISQKELSSPDSNHINLNSMALEKKNTHACCVLQ